MVWGKHVSYSNINKKIYFEGQVVEEYASPSIGTGITYKPIVRKIFQDMYHSGSKLVLPHVLKNDDVTFFFGFIRPALSPLKGFSCVGTVFFAKN